MTRAEGAVGLPAQYAHFQRALTPRVFPPRENREKTLKTK